MKKHRTIVTSLGLAFGIAAHQAAASFSPPLSQQHEKNLATQYYMADDNFAEVTSAVRAAQASEAEAAKKNANNASANHRRTKIEEFISVTAFVCMVIGVGFLGREVEFYLHARKRNKTAKRTNQLRLLPPDQAGPKG